MQRRRFFYGFSLYLHRIFKRFSILLRDYFFSIYIYFKIHWRRCDNVAFVIYICTRILARESVPAD